MSLHAELTPEAQARLDALQRNSTVSSIICGILGVVLIALICAFFTIEVLVRRNKPIVTYKGPEARTTKTEKTKINNPINRTPAAPSRAMARVMAAATTSPTMVPTVEFLMTEPSLDFGTGDDFGEGGIGDGTGKDPFINLPPGFGKRCSQQDRMMRLQENGGTGKCEEAVVKGLDWLKKTQAGDGSWGGSNKPAMTGLALLAYLGHCETPLSENYGDTVFRGLVYLIDLGMQNNGKLVPVGAEKDKHWPYEHAIACYALAEATTFCKQLGINVPQLQQVTQAAGQYIIDNQHQSGGWDYAYSENTARGGDLSITAWHIQALKACKLSGLEFRNLRRCSSRALDYVAARHASDGGFCYTGNSSNRPYKTLTGAGMLCMQMWDKASHSGVRDGAKYILKNSKFDYNSEFCDLYGHYYESQAMMNRGGEQWKAYNGIFRDQVLDNQAPDGSWLTPGGGKKPRAVAASFVGNTHYRTCLNILMLEVYYRFLPSTGGGI